MTFFNTPAPSDVTSFEVVLKLAFTRNGHAVQMRRVRLANPTIDSLKATVQRWARGSFTLQYTDCEGDTVTMDAEEEWAECLALWRAAGDTTAPLAVQVEQATGKRAASPSGAATAAADSSADDAVHGASSSDVESEGESPGSDGCEWMELLGMDRKGGKKGLCAKGMKGCKGMKGRKGKKAWLKRCLFARRCGGGNVEDEKVAAAEDAAAEDCAVAEGEACVEALAQLAANDGTSNAGTACEDEDFAWDFDPSGKLKGGKGMKGRKGAAKGLKRCFFARRCGWEVEDGLGAEPVAEGGSDSGAEHELAWDLDGPAGKKGMKGGKGLKGCKGTKGWMKRCLFARRCRGWEAEDAVVAEDAADDSAMTDEEECGGAVDGAVAAADAVADDDFAWYLDAAGKKGMKGGKGMKGCKGRKGWMKRCLFARRCRGWEAEDAVVAEDAADDCAMTDEEKCVEAVDDTCADAAACDHAGKLGMKGCKGMKGRKGRRILKAWAAAQNASEAQRAQVALVADEQAAGAAAEPPAACAGCGFVVTGVTPGHCCKRCSKNAGAHGPRCAQLTPEEAQVGGVPVSPVEWRGRKSWAAKYAAASGQPAGCEGGAAPVAMGMKGGKKGKKGAKGCKGEKVADAEARGERRSWLSAFSWWGAEDGVPSPAPSAPEAEPAEACLDAPSTDSPVKEVV